MFTIIHEGASLQVRVSNDPNEIPKAIKSWTGLQPTDYYLTQNGRLVSFCFSSLLVGVPLRMNKRLPGGKGGFGSMLRAIGAQIEKTTNREACRDLSGRRLRDINEEKRLKTYLEKQQDASDDERAKMQKKIEKLLSKPKHEFEDKEYELQRSELIVETDEALREGLQKVVESKQHGPIGNDSQKQQSLVGKRKQAVLSASKKSKKKKSTLWLGNDDLSSSSETDSESAEPSGSTGGGKVSSLSKKVEQCEKKTVANSNITEEAGQQAAKVTASTSNSVVRSE